MEDHEEISHDSRLLGEHASFPKTREHKRREGDATSMIQPLQSQDLRPQTVIIRKGLLGGVQVMLYAGQHYHLAKNNQDLLARAQALVKDVGKGDYPCPLELSVHAVF